jgi:two-component system chemotaxis response regulator CheY
MIMSAMNGRKVLFVEDSLTMRRIIANSLKQVGFDNIIEAENGADAIEKLAGQAIDLVVTDWNMPEMNGAELVQVLRSLPQYQEVPIVMVTTRGMQEDVITAMKLGVNGYIIKPFTPDILGEKIKSVMN